jgi:glycogen operon protein
MPEFGRGMRWNLFLDTAADSPDDIFPDGDGPVPQSSRVIKMPHHSLKVFVSQK